MNASADLMPLHHYAAHRQHCRSVGYCDPFVPYRGDRYGADGTFKFVYCGAAAWWSEAHADIDDDGEALRASATWSRNFVNNGTYDSPFWRLFNQIAAALPDFAEAQPDEWLSRFAWTNISKTGTIRESAPPDSDAVLRELDIAQFRHEMDVLKPDLIVCVSGSLVPSTAFALFDTEEWAIIPEVRPTTEKTWIRQAPWGGWLLWTMHPAYKPASWAPDLLADVQTILDLRSRG